MEANRESTGRVLVVCGHQELDLDPESSRWGRGLVFDVVSRLPAGSTVVTTVDRCAAMWAQEAAVAMGHELAIFHLEGYVFQTGRRTWLWDLPPWCPSPHAPVGDRGWWKEARDRAMVRWVSGQPVDRECLVLIDPKSTDRGPENVMQLSVEAGVSIIKHEWKREEGPPSTRGGGTDVR